ncbi:hypothetical protein BBP40_011803, partial [Aspergillus hancockii]
DLSRTSKNLTSGHLQARGVEPSPLDVMPTHKLPTYSGHRVVTASLFEDDLPGSDVKAALWE